MARTIFSERNGASHLDHLYKMFIFNRAVEQYMENFKNLKPENWAK